MSKLICAEDYKPLIPDGVYEAQCIKHDEGFLMGKTRKLFLNFKILSQGEYYGVELFQAYNINHKKKISSGSKYYKTWVMVNGWNKPSKGAIMSARIFINKMFKIKTRTTKPKRDGKPMPENFWYSVVDEIIEVIA